MMILMHVTHENGEMIGHFKNSWHRDGGKPQQRGTPMVVVTEELLRAGMADNGGYTRAQFQLVGVLEWPPLKGWKRSVLGSLIPRADAEEFLRIRRLKREEAQAPTLF
jgi:hypothetical protein